MKRREAHEYRRKIEHAAQTQTDADALESIELFPLWKPDTHYEKDERVQYDGKLWRTMQTHTSQSDWNPSITTASLFSLVAPPDEGTQDNPIPFAIGMALEYGKYYSENGKTYYCFVESLRDNPYTTSFSLIYYGSLVREVV